MKKRNERAIKHVVIATGISSVVTQLITVREFISQFQGNEFVIALMLFNWFVLGGIGVFLARFFARRFFQPGINHLGWISLCLACLPVIQILAIREFRDIIFLHGSSVGFYGTFAYIFLLITPYCLLLGFALPYSLFVLRTEISDYPGTRIYIADNIGDVCGGALFSFAFVYLLTPLQAISLTSLILTAASYCLFPPTSRNTPWVLAALCVSLFVFVFGLYIEPYTLFPPEGRLAWYKESRYGRIEVFEDKEQYTLVTDGFPLFSNQDVGIAEEAVHYPMSQITSPEHVLLVSAQAGMMEEVRKYHPKTVDYLEIDPDITAALFRFNLMQNIPGLKVIHEDARAYLKTSHTLYDAVIINLTEPETFQLNRFFTTRFFKLCREHLSPRGVLSFSMEGFDSYLAEPQRQKLSSLFNTASQQFKHVVLLPGQKVFFICADYPVRHDIPVLLKEKNIRTKYISGFYSGDLTEQRIAYVNNLMDPLTPLNRDTTPHLMHIMFTQWFARFSNSPAVFMLSLGVIMAGYLIRIRKEEFVMFTTGFTAMGSEILVIFAFQIFFGYIYVQIGLIVTAFLAGLLPGAWFGEKLRNKGKYAVAVTDGILIMLLCLFIFGVRQYADSLPNACYLVFGFLISLTCGFQFPAALHLGGGDNASATRIFSSDLIGAAFGTLATSVVFIPYLGIIFSAVCLIAIKTISIVVAGTYNEKYR